MAQYRRKPIVVDAVQWQGGFGFTEKPSWLVRAYKDGVVRDDENDLGGQKRLYVKSRGKDLVARPGDYVVHGDGDRIWVCDRVTFEEAYERTDAEPKVAPTA